MRSLRWIALATAICSSTVTANELKITEKRNERQVCSGIYSKSDWGGPKDVFIDAAIQSEQKEGWIAAVIFNYANVDDIGADIPHDKDRKYLCDDQAVAAHLCEKEQIGTFILSKSADTKMVVTKKIDLANPVAMRFDIKTSGYYCVSTYPSSADIKYNAAIVFQNAYGDLSASQIPKLPFFGGAALAYALLFALWMFQYVQHRSDILPVQNYVTAICAFLMVEMIVIWGYYDFINNGAGKTGSLVYLILLSVLNSFRNAFTFFLLLIVCMGYGVVKPSLGDIMWKCRALAGAHFLFAVMYTITSYVVSPDTAGPFVLLLILPLSLTMTTFYVWILSSLTGTIKYLEERNQLVKAQMYKNLWRVLLASIVVIFGFFFINSMIFARQSALEFITSNWKSRWFMLDGWLNVVYFVDFAIIAFMWRPTANNRRFAMSSQIAQDENEAQEFEIGSLRDSLDEEEAVGAHSPTQQEIDDEVAIIRGSFAPPVEEAQQGKARDTDLPPYSTGNTENVFSVDDDEDDSADELLSDDGSEGDKHNPK